MSFKKLPYGQSNFADLIERNYAYVDKTRFIELLENENNTYQFFIRPRRFGKSLFLSALENYYDLNKKDKFESIFGNLYIGKHPTPEQGTYAVITFNFSGLNTANAEVFYASFLDRIEQCVFNFFEKYKNIFTNAADFQRLIVERKSGIGTLDFVYGAAVAADVKIFVIVDEYDHFANGLIAMGEMYKKEVGKSGIVRSFYEQLKVGTSSVVRRIFITGISPMMVNDLTSGFNMATDYSLFPKYNEMLGFTKEEVDRLMIETGVDKNLIKVDMEYYYNGYMFYAEAENKVYNSQMVLYLFNQILQFNKQSEHVVDPNLRIDYTRLHRLAENEDNQEILRRIVKDGGTFGQIIERFSVDELSYSRNFVSLLFFLGMLTNSGETQMGKKWLKIPNYSIKTLYWDYIVSSVLELESKPMDILDELSDTISKMAYRGDFKPYLDFFTENFLKRLSNRDLINFDEKYIKVMLLSTLFTSRLYLPVSESENINGYTDIYLQKHPSIIDMKYEYVFEIKYVKTGTEKAEKDAKFAEAMAQIEKYKKDARFANRDDLKFLAIVFEGKGDYEIQE